MADLFAPYGLTETKANQKALVSFRLFGNLIVGGFADGFAWFGCTFPICLKELGVVGFPLNHVGHEPLRCDTKVVDFLGIGRPAPYTPPPT